MRISDWSSDVCSSDLAVKGTELVAGGDVLGVEDIEDINRHSKTHVFRQIELWGERELQIDVLGPLTLHHRATRCQHRAVTIQITVERCRTKLRCDVVGWVNALTAKERKGVVKGKSVSVRVNHGGGRNNKKK